MFGLKNVSLNLRTYDPTNPVTLYLFSNLQFSNFNTITLTNLAIMPLRDYNYANTSYTSPDDPKYKFVFPYTHNNTMVISI